ncbi:GntR family transcriptional regulator [Streptomyces triticirhizae]|uniref:GntR family transcriptional regulator n=1 Tax=Streptomyces triticirhizae TaxID=2483353 RepID=A0A3M2LIE5_9ACTN|nr:GntR family transcriptional regulator [Streptomyces triticirhizae]RMI37234.1 GntR family transcriptional regulator [Streptomyces triticirhizae]
MTGAESGRQPVRRREILREAVADALRAAVVSGEMEPGVVYSAPALAARFGVSATPVREAMLDLVREGMVDSVPNKGFRVTEISPTDLDHIVELRLLIEPITVWRVVPLVPEEDLPTLGRMAQRIVDRAECGDLLGYSEADRRFHLALLAYGGNPALVQTISQLHARTRLLGLSSVARRGRLRAAAEEHQRLVELIALRDQRGARTLMRAHIEQMRPERTDDTERAGEAERAEDSRTDRAV